MKEKIKKSSSISEEEISNRIYEKIEEGKVSDFRIDEMILEEIENSMSFSKDWQKYYAKERIKNRIKENNSDFLPTIRTKRFLNFILDCAGLYIFSYIFGFLLGITGLYFVLNINEWFLGILILTFYYGIFEFIWSKTPAKFITKTKVIMENGEKPDSKTIFIRTLIRFIPFESLTFLDSEHPKGWHDRWSKTIVVNDISICKEN